MSSQRMVKSVGDQELALLRFIAGQGQVSVAEAVEGFGRPRELARSTVLTMMERLRKKGHLGRRHVDGVYRYAARATAGNTVRDRVQTFVDRTLGGSISPFVTYLAERERLSDEELDELETLLTRLQQQRRRRR